LSGVDTVFGKEVVKVLRDSIIEFYGLSDWNMLKSHMKEKSKLDITKYEDVLEDAEVVEKEILELFGESADVLIKVLNCRLIALLSKPDEAGNLKNLLYGSLAELIYHVKQARLNVKNNPVP
jgi:hypothetical protein